MTKFTTLLIIIFSLISLKAIAETANYALDPMHTNVVWSANHFGFSSPSGKFAKVEGTIKLDENKPSNSNLDVTIDTTSITTGLAKFDEHLKSPDFFNTEKFPTAIFTSTKIEQTSKKTAKVHGNLTMLGITKPVILDVKLNKIDIHPYTQKRTAGFSASTTIKRSEFGMNYAMGGVSDEVNLTIESEASII